MEGQWSAVNGSDGNTTTVISPLSESKVSLIGYPGPVFTAIHISALSALSISNVISACLIIYLCGCTCRRKTSKSKTIKEQSGSRKQKSDGASGDSDIHTKVSNSVSPSGAIMRKGKPAPSNKQHIRYFWKWNVGERFVLYLATCDIGYGISHSIDHIYIYRVIDYPPDILCAFFGFLLHQFSVGQWFVVSICAVSACSLIVFGKKLSLGRWDWRLLAVAFVLPLVVGIFGIVYRMFGATGDWCYVSIETVNGLRYTTVITVFQIVLYGVVTVAYAAIWFKIRRTTRLMEGSSTSRYQSSEQIMLIFVVVFIFQWSVDVMFAIWVLIDGNPPPVLLAIDVTVVNLGGLYNCFAYTVVRRYLQTQKKNSGVNAVVVSNFRKPTQNAVDRVPTTAVSSATIEDKATEMAATTGTADSSKQHETTRF